MCVTTAGLGRVLSTVGLGAGLTALSLGAVTCTVTSERNASLEDGESLDLQAPKLLQQRNVVMGSARKGTVVVAVFQPGCATCLILDPVLRQVKQTTLFVFYSSSLFFLLSLRR